MKPLDALDASGTAQTLQTPGKAMKFKRPVDAKTGFDISDDFERFDQRNEIYCRSEWDPEIKSEKADEFFRGHDMPHARARKADGFGQRDYALRNATWHVTNVLRDMRRQSDDRRCPGGVGRTRPGGFGPFRGHGRPRGGSQRPSEPTFRRREGSRPSETGAILRAIQRPVWR